ncbi:MAG: MarR family transcriptional regulator [Clostridia bacterium]|nr:MarR family transcriptional regulator [Clostridia bacterium]
MEMNRELKDSIMKLSMLIRRLEMPRPHEPGLRGHAQKRALLLIALNEGISQRELCEKMGIQPSSASELLGKLEARGLINKAADPNDLRTVFLSVTEQGKRVLENGEEQEDALSAFDALGDSEKQEMKASADKLIDACEERCRERGLHMFPPRPEGGDGGCMPFGGPGRRPFPHGERPPFEGRPHFPGRPFPRRLPNPVTDRETEPRPLKPDDIQKL